MHIKHPPPSSDFFWTHRILRRAPSTGTIGYTVWSQCSSSSQPFTENTIALFSNSSRTPSRSGNTRWADQSPMKMASDQNQGEPSRHGTKEWPGWWWQVMAKGCEQAGPSGTTCLDAPSQVVHCGMDGLVHWVTSNSQRSGGKLGNVDVNVDLIKTWSTKRPGYGVIAWWRHMDANSRLYAMHQT